MNKRHRITISMVLLMASFLPYGAFAERIQSCTSAATKTGKTYKVNGSGVTVRQGPGENFGKIVNQKATDILKKTIYIKVDKSVTVYEECSEGEWSKIRVTDPSYLSESHRGWVESKYLRAKKTDLSGAEVFTEADFSFTDKTRPYKNIIIEGVNKVHREKSRCKKIDPSSAYISGSKGTKSNPVFFVTCGEGIKAFNVFFSKSDIEGGNKIPEQRHISKAKATELCEKHAKANAAHPSTVDFSRVFDLSIHETPNGRTRVTSTFTAKNSFNLELKHNISCLLDSNGLIEAAITEAR